MSLRFSAPLLVAGGLALAMPAHAQVLRFDLRAEPNVIPANGLSTTSILVQVPQNTSSISQNQPVRFTTTAGRIESQAMLTGGVARVLLRSSSTPETATINAFIGSAHETITVEFSQDTGLRERYLEVDAPYVAYGNGTGIITSSGKSSMNFGDLHIESDVRLDVDLNLERIWAQGNAGGVIISNGRGGSKVELRGDRLFYDLRKRQGVIRRSVGDTTNTSTGARQEFVGSKFEVPTPSLLGENAPTAKKAEQPSLIAPPQAPAFTPQGRENLADGSVAPVAEAAPTQPDKTEAAPTIEPEPAAPTDAEKAAPEAAPLGSPTESPQSQPLLTGKIPDTPVPGAPTIVPDSPTDEPAPLVTEGNTLANQLVTPAKPGAPGSPDLHAEPPSYQPLPQSDITPNIVELPPPNFNVKAGLWVTARRLRVFPRDEVQFDHASIYVNGGKAFGMPQYVLPLDGSFDPQTDMVSFNTSGGIGLRVPYYYQASKYGTGAVFFNNSMRSGFGTQTSGPSLEVQQQYWLSSRSHGNFSIDQIGRGNFNVNYAHEQQLDSRTVANLYINAPRHRDLYGRATIARDLSNMQIGFEGFFDRPEGDQSNVRGQFFARMRPKSLGKSGWSYSLSANALAVQRVPFQLSNGGTDNGDGDQPPIIIPGQDGGTGGGTTTTTGYRALIGQTLNASMTSPTYSPWRGASLNVNLLATVFNYSDRRRGLAPGVNLTFGQALGKSANLSFGYTYDKSSIGLYGVSTNSFNHYFTANAYANLTKKIAVSLFGSRSLSDKSLYGNAGVDYYFAPKWRAGAFLDYANFSLSSTNTLTTGWSLGRTIGSRELAVNYDTLRSRLYVSYGGAGLGF